METQYHQNISMKQTNGTLMGANRFIMFPEITQKQKVILDMGSETPYPDEFEKETITIELVDDADSEEVLKLLKTFFFKDEPLNTYLNLGECKELEEYSLKSINDNCSFKALNSKGQIVGVFLCGIINKPTVVAEPESHAENCKHEKFKKVMKLMDYIDTQFSIFDLYPNEEKFVDGKIISVNENFRGLGIAGKLTDKVIEFMQHDKINLFHVLCTSHYSARVMEKMNFHEVYNLPFEDFLVDGEQLLCPAKPHVSARILVKEVLK